MIHTPTTPNNILSLSLSLPLSLSRSLSHYHLSLSLTGEKHEQRRRTKSVRVIYEYMTVCSQFETEFLKSNHCEILIDNRPESPIFSFLISLSLSPLSLNLLSLSHTLLFIDSHHTSPLLYPPLPLYICTEYHPLIPFFAVERERNR